MKRKKFLRRDARRFKRLGMKWRKARGRDNKIREKRRGYPKKVSIGYKQNKKTRSKINNKKIIKISKIKDLEKVKKENIAFLGRLGQKKKIEIAKKAKDTKFVNFNPKKFLKQHKKEEKKIESGEKKK